MRIGWSSPGSAGGGDVAPTAPHPARDATHALAVLQQHLLAGAWADTADPQARACLRRAAQDAAALAWLSGFPLLTFPELFEEQRRSALARLERQRAIRARSQITLWSAARAGMSALLRRRPGALSARVLGAQWQPL